jgi:hypothetical protein
VESLVPPFFAVEGWDIWLFESLDAMARGVEANDVNDNDFYDARGMPLTAHTKKYLISGFRVAPGGQLEAEKLGEALRASLTHLPERFARYAEAAARAESLHDLVEIYTR